MDFFNYAGLHRDVIIYIKPNFNVQDVNIKTDYDSNLNQGKVNYQVITNCNNDLRLNVTIFDQNEQVISVSHNLSDSIIISNPQLWWPRFLGKSKIYGYLYTLKVNKILYFFYLLLFLSFNNF
jgi:beta-glucuronidase